jgi:hypothetical protein
MGLRVIWSYAAVDDLEVAAEYLHRDSPSFSSSFVLRALEAGRSLSDFPERVEAGGCQVLTCDKTEPVQQSGCICITLYFARVQG